GPDTLFTIRQTGEAHQTTQRLADKLRGVWTLRFEG
ncbi:hypothetical protein PSYJA_46306, partial [Pseudomonas syringae pv. japonica str. M301072]